VIANSPPGDLPPDIDLLVHPVYLAGRGDTAPVHEALRDARGWGKATTATGLMFTSPRQDAQVAYLPESRYGGWKAVQYREPLGTPLWWATFSRNTPAEITSAFTTALAEGLPSNHRDFLHGGPDLSSPAGALAEGGWQTDDTAMYLYQRSPDGHAYFALRKGELDDYMELEGEGPAQWTMYGCVDHVNGERWHADFTSSTPLYLVRKAVLALSSTEPVERPLSGIPERNLPYVTVSPVGAGTDQRRSAALARTPPHPSQAGVTPTIASAAADMPAPGPSRHR
jgi:hypothetical protein